MRWLFLSVLTLNIVYIAWQLNSPAEDRYLDEAKINNARTIVLLSELKKQSEAEILSDQHAESGDAVITGLVVEEVPSVDVRSEAVDVSDEAVNEPGIEASIEVHSDIESADVNLAQVDEADTDTKTGVQTVVEVNSCYTVGPFRDLEKLRAFVRDIKSYVIEADFRDREEKERSVYWVYIAPEKSRKKARELGKRLKSKKIKDFYIIREGDKNNGISLGHFKEKKRAYGLAKKVKRKGFDVSVEPLFKAYTLYWLDYKLVAGQSIPAVLDNKYLSSGNKDNISRLSRDCKT